MVLHHNRVLGNNQFEGSEMLKKTIASLVCLTVATLVCPAAHAVAVFVPTVTPTFATGSSFVVGSPTGTDGLGHTFQIDIRVDSIGGGNVGGSASGLGSDLSGLDPDLLNGGTAEQLKFTLNSAAYNFSPLGWTVNVLGITGIQVFDLDSGFVAPYSTDGVTFFNTPGGSGNGLTTDFATLAASPGVPSIWVKSNLVDTFQVSGLWLDTIFVPPPPASVPEPSTWLAMLGVASVIGARQIRRRKTVA